MRKGNLDIKAALNKANVLNTVTKSELKPINSLELLMSGRTSTG